MRRIILAVAAAIAAITVIAAVIVPPGPRTVSVQWDYDTNNVPDVFKLYTSDDRSEPLTNWLVIATVPGTAREIAVSNLVPQRAWFFVTASNWWGETPPSNITGIPQPLSPVSNLRIFLR